MLKRLIAAALVAICLVSVPVVFASIDGVISVTFTVNDRRTIGLNTGANLSVNSSPSITYSNGTGANQANVLYQAVRTLSAGADSVALFGVLQDSYGTTVNLVRVKGIYLKNLSASNPQTYGADASHPWSSFLNNTGTITLPPGAFVGGGTPDATGWTVGVSDVIKVTGTGTDQYQIVIVGASS
jgi:hypothetical protein